MENESTQIMKTKLTLSLTAVAVGLIVGCSKQEEPAPTEETAVAAPQASATTTTTAPANNMASSLTQDTSAATEAMKETAKEMTETAKTVANDTTEEVKSMAAEMTDKFNETVAQVKQYIEDGKYQESLDALKQLAEANLTPEQMKIVDDLKAKVQEAMAKMSSNEAVKAIGNLPGGGN